MLTGIHHVALLTSDMDRFIAFYTEVFGATVTVDVTEGDLRHALLDIGAGGALHPFAIADNPNGRGSPEMFARGHLDHIALNVADEETFQELRRRLVDAGVSDGTVTDFGPVKTCVFRDPDGMDCEIALWKEGELLSFEDRILEPYRSQA